MLPLTTGTKVRNGSQNDVGRFWLVEFSVNDSFNSVLQMCFAEINKDGFVNRFKNTWPKLRVNKKRGIEDLFCCFIFIQAL